MEDDKLDFRLQRFPKKIPEKFLPSHERQVIIIENEDLIEQYIRRRIERNLPILMARGCVCMKTHKVTAAKLRQVCSYYDSQSASRRKIIDKVIMEYVAEGEVTLNKNKGRPFK